MWYQSYEHDRMHKLSAERRDLAYGIVRDPAGPAYESDLSEGEADTLHRRRQYTPHYEPLILDTRTNCGPPHDQDIEADKHLRTGDVWEWADYIAKGRPYRLMIDTEPEMECLHRKSRPQYIYIIRDAVTGRKIHSACGRVI